MTRQDDVAGLVALIDRLEALLERSSLSELEVETAGTTVVLRTPSALVSPAVSAAPTTAAGVEAAARLPAVLSPILPSEPAQPATHLVVAPLTGVFYRSPSPGAEPYLREGGQVSAGQVIGLIEAMKLFNEIKSDMTGTVRRLVAGDGALVKAREALIEVVPA